MRSLATVIVIFICTTTYLTAQIQVGVAWKQDTINLGDKVKLELSVLSPTGTSIESIETNFLDSIISGFQTLKMRNADTTKAEEFAYADIELIDGSGLKDVDENGFFDGTELKWNESTVNNQVLKTNEFELRVYDPGQIVARSPAVAFSINGQPMMTGPQNQASLFVRPPIDLDQVSQDSMDIGTIKTIIKEPVKISDYFIYGYILGGLLLAFLGFKLFERFKNREEEVVIEEEEIIIPAHEIALDRLTALDEKQLWQDGDIKGYQSELTDIVREYLENRYEVPALESTTDEIVTYLKKNDLTTDMITELRNILQVADLVKFAKSKPTVSIHQEFMDKAVSFVKTTMKIEEQEV